MKKGLVTILLAAGTILSCSKDVTKPQTEPVPDPVHFEGKIVYVSATKNPSEYPILPSVIESITEAGGIKAITGNSGNNTQPKVSPDTSMVAYRSGHVAHPGVYISSSAGLTLDEVMEGDVVDFQWSPDNTRLVISRMDRFNRGTIFLAPLNGDVTALTDSSSSNIEAAFSPDGNKIIFASDRDNADEFQIYTMNVDGSNPTRITRGRNPEYSPDGLMIAYILPSYQLWSSGGLQTFNTQTDHIDFYKGGVRDFTWNPTSSKIACTSIYNLNIMEADLNTREVRELTPRGSDSSDPSYSPDGDHLVFSMTKNGNADLYMIPSGGGNIERLTTSPKMELLPQWK
jgi:TolB protein